MAVNDASLQSVQAQTIRIQGHSPARADSRVFPLAFFTPRTPEIVEPVDPRSVARKRSRAGGSAIGAISDKRVTARWDAENGHPPPRGVRRRRAGRGVVH